MILKSIFILSMFYLSETHSETNEGYGSYDIKFKGCGLCRGTKASNLTISWIKVENDGNKLDTYANITFFEPQTTINEVKISAYELKDAKKNVLINYKIDNPCERAGMGGTFKKYLKTSNCIVRKGNYLLKLQIAELTKYVFGPSYFYGDYYIKGVMLSKKGNIICILSRVEVFKSRES